MDCNQESLQDASLRGDALEKQGVSAISGLQLLPRFTMLQSSHPIGKVVWIEDGELRKAVGGVPKKFMHHPIEFSTIEDLAEVFGRANERMIFISGVSSAEAGQFVRRAKDAFPLPIGPGVMFVDNDTHHGHDQFHALYTRACPCLSEASYVHAPSSGSFIYDSEGGEVLGAKGQHYAVPVEDAQDIPRALETLHQRCILAGFGIAVVYENGNVAIKSPVDTAMKTSIQPLFQRVTAEGGLVQRKGPHIHAHCGAVFLLDTRQAIPDLSAEERARLATIELTLRLSVADEQELVKARYIAANAPKIAEANGWSQKRAVVELEAALAQHVSGGARGPQVDLWAGMKIKFDKFGSVDVADVLAEPDKFHGQTCDDPMEPNYKPGSQVARCYAKDKFGTPHPHPGIHSFAHNSHTVYHLKRDLSGIDIDLRAAQEAQETRKALAMGTTGDSLCKTVEQAGAPTQTLLAGFQILEMPGGMRATEFVIDGILPNGVTVIAGAPGAGKTTNLLPMAACAAHLSPAVWDLHPKRRRSVIWLSEHPDQVFDTIEAVLRLEGSASREEFAQWFKVLPTRRSSPEELAALITVANAKFSWTNDRGVVVHPLIVWDTAAATIDVENENDNTVISKAIALAKQALDGGALWVITHTPKASKDAIDASQMSARGGSAYEGDANCTAYLYQDRDGRRVLALGKIRFAAAYPEIHFDSARHTQIVVDHFDGQELDKTVVCGVPSPGSKQARQQAKIDTNRLIQRDAILQAATSATEAGALCSANDLLARLTIPMKKATFIAMVNGMLEEGVLSRVQIPQDLRQALKLNNRKIDAILPMSANPATVFAMALLGSVGSQTTDNQLAGFLKSEGVAA